MALCSSTGKMVGSSEIDRYADDFEARTDFYRKIYHELKKYFENYWNVSPTDPSGPVTRAINLLEEYRGLLNKR